MKDYKIYAFLDEMPENFSITPKNIDYNILGLHKKRTIVKGELVKIEYYSEYDGTTYNDLILIEERSYERDANGIIIKRDMTIKWIFDDDTISADTKHTIKFYSNAEKIDEGIKRRKNIISNLKLIAFGLLGKVNAYDLLNACVTDMQIYIDGDRTVLINNIANMNKTYLDGEVQPGLTIRNYIISELTF